MAWMQIPLTGEKAEIQVMEDEEVSNILLIGQDRRKGEDRQRSDSIIICGVNKDKGVIVPLTSVYARDTPRADSPGYKDNRINAAYQFGGMELLDEVIEENLGVHIDGNVEVDFDGFMESLSVLGNLDIELNATEAKYLNSHSDLSETDENGWTLKEGVISMTRPSFWPTPGPVLSEILTGSGQSVSARY